MESHHGFAEVNGTSLYYEVTGTGFPIVLIHGGSLDTRIWHDQVLRFAQHYQVLRYDLRGYGKSAVPTEQPYAHTDDLQGLLNSLGITQTHIIGHSIGGGIAIDFALAHPDATASLVLLDSSLSGYQWPSALTTETRAVRDLALGGDMQDAKQRWMQNAVFAPALEQPEVASRLTQIIADYSGWGWLHANPVQPPDPPAIGQLGRVTVPTIVLVGERDTPYNHEIADIIQQGIPSADKVVIPGVGHMPSMEYPERFNDVVLKFLAEI